jgi:NIPSNAP
MIVDLRIYKCKPNKMNEWVALYKDMAWPLQQKYLGRCLGWFTTVEGELNCVVHLWAYESQADREARRNAMQADPAWQAFLKRGAELQLLDNQENRILRPTDFSPVQ